MISFVPTPIGNKEDITLRAIRLLKESQIFLCEDTRTAKKLCNLYDISLIDKQFFPLTGFTQQHAIQRYCNTFRDQQVVVLSEAGTPGLSDPGKMLVKRLWYYQIPYEVLPGANALIPAVVAIPCDTSHFQFRGFLPTKKGRKTMIQQLCDSKLPVIVYESVHRIQKLCQELVDHNFDGKIFVARELSKKFEQKIFVTPRECLTLIVSGELPCKGEFVVGIVPSNFIHLI